MEGGQALEEKRVNRLGPSPRASEQSGCDARGLRNHRASGGLARVCYLGWPDAEVQGTVAGRILSRSEMVLAAPEQDVRRRPAAGGRHSPVRADRSWVRGPATVSH